MKRVSLALALALVCACVARAAAPEAGGSAATGASSAQAINLSHFNHLYADIEIDSKPIGLVHIYSQYPDYAYAIEPREGFTCVDDVARSVVMLVREWRRNPQPELMRKIRRLTGFVLHLQNPNGYFNNFLWGDLRVNVDYKTSVAELNWWSFRALWSLEEAYPLLEHDADVAARIREATHSLVDRIKADLLKLPHRRARIEGMDLPTWLPAGSGADEAGEAIVALLPHLKRTGDADVRRLIESLADGVMLMQRGDADHYPYGMFLSWQNQWHAWGNIQAYALLAAGEQLGRKDYIASALREVDNFYPYLLRNGFAESMAIRQQGGADVELSRSRYPQIAYGIRPMVFAALKAHALTGDAKYRRLADDLGAWLLGRNDANAQIYDANTGIVFDGIRAAGALNRNSGAESTIEALLILQALRDSNP